MENALVAVIIIALMFFCVLTLYQSALDSLDSIFANWKEMDKRMTDRSQTSLSVVGVDVTDVGGTIELTVLNSGNNRLADFERWDVIIQYNNGAQVAWYTYGNNLNEWRGYITDLVEDGIFNPGEEMVVQIAISPPIQMGTTNQAIIGAPNGITASTAFAY